MSSSPALPPTYDNAPDWFNNALQIPYETRQADVDGCTIEYLRWGDTRKPLLMFVHGNGGHAQWWSFIAPSFLDDYCVCAVNLSGMGDSGYRPEYSFDIYARDVIGAAAHAGYTRDITIVGHSMGGVVTMRVAENYPEAIKAIVIVDSPMVFRLSNDASEQHKPAPPAHHSFKGKKYYADFATTLSHYHLVPPQPCANKFLVDHVAQHSIKQFPQGWSWKFDEGIYFNFKRSGKLPPFDLDKILCQFAYIHGSDSALVPQRVIPDLHKMLENKGKIYEIAGAHHHVMLDEPLALIARLQEILKGW
jgi:pimeloyl-ACP methyl ester carboxylesterase